MVERPCDPLGLSMLFWHLCPVTRHARSPAWVGRGLHYPPCSLLWMITVGLKPRPTAVCSGEEIRLSRSSVLPYFFQAGVHLWFLRSPILSRLALSSFSFSAQRLKKA